MFADINTHFTSSKLFEVAAHIHDNNLHLIKQCEHGEGEISPLCDQHFLGLTVQFPFKVCDMSHFVIMPL